MSYTLGEAAKAVKKSKTTLHRAIKYGKISAAKADNGSYIIEPSELHRVFPSVIPDAPLQRNDMEQYRDTLETLRIKLEMQEKECELLKETVTDLREERNKWRQQATALLEDKRSRKWWKWR